MNRQQRRMQAIRWKRATDALRRLRLTPRLLFLISTGQLEQAVADAQRELDLLNDLLDAWEARNPELAAQVPWAQTRAAWKAAGRPRADWWDALQWYLPTDRWKPLKEHVVDRDLYAHRERRLRYAAQGLTAEGKPFKRPRASPRR